MRYIIAYIYIYTYFAYMQPIPQCKPTTLSATQPSEQPPPKNSHQKNQPHEPTRTAYSNSMGTRALRQARHKPVLRASPKLTQ